MSYKLDFFDSFVCSGSACKNTCCSGWDIALDKETYDFYEASHGAFSKYVKKNIGQTDGNYFIKMTEKNLFILIRLMKWVFVRFIKNMVRSTWGIRVNFFRGPA